MDHRRHLLDKFKNYTQGADDPELDEIEITEIFDLAGDDSDNALQHRIIDYGMRRYPSYQPMLIRRAYLALDEQDVTTARSIARNVDKSLTLRQILEIHCDIVDGVDPDKAHSRLEHTLDNAEALDDEDVIRLLGAAMDTDNGYQWLNEHIDTLRRKTTYLPSLIYEMAQYARDAGEKFDAVKYAEELTMIEPFELSHWQLLTEIHIEQQQLDSALSDLEYCLALSPESAHTRNLMAHVKILTGTSPDELVDSVADLIFTEDTEMNPLMSFISGYELNGQSDKAIELAERYLERFPASANAPVAYLLTRIDEDDRRLDIMERYYHGTGITSEIYWMEWARELFRQGQYKAVVAVLEVVTRHQLLGDYSLLLLSLYYSNSPGRAVEVILEKNLVNMDNIAQTDEANRQPGTVDGAELLFPSRITYSLVLLMSLIRINREKFAANIINAELSSIESFMRPASIACNVSYMGYGELLRSILRGVEDGTYPDEYDPLLMPENIKKKDKNL